MESTAKSFNVRSTSFPSKSHPNLARVQECLHVFKAWEASPSKKAQFVTSLAHLKDLYISINAFLQLPLSQQALCGKERLVGQLMDDFVCLMDVCGMVKDSLLHMKEQYEALRSMLRRGDSGLEASICAYHCSRKRMKKDMAKCLSLLRSVEKHVCSSNDNLDVVDQVLKDVRAAAVSILTFLSSIISGRKASQSIFSKFRTLGSKSQNEKGIHDGASDIEKADVAILSLYGHSSKAVKEVDARDAQKQMEAVDLKLRETEVELEDFFRCIFSDA
ncbi:uncharacterized protein LOC116260698 [Nymphaea colorata]|uniref:DUF241 domain-containing protein n=1 Tax=Nymphaea colorata TaxID=210225 RepID=A0A5K1H3Z6_9MAGN|nr:uncharacterized protein LOC116260698 [Nymphaea colorata]